MSTGRSYAGAWGAAILLQIDDWHLLDPVALDIIQQELPAPIRVYHARHPIHTSNYCPRVFALRKRKGQRGYFWAIEPELEDRFAPVRSDGARSFGPRLWARSRGREQCVTAIRTHLLEALAKHGTSRMPKGLPPKKYAKNNLAFEDELWPSNTAECERLTAAIKQGVVDVDRLPRLVWEMAR